MSIRKKKTPDRRPHPDPAVELHLLRILDLRASIGRRAQLSDDYRRQISSMMDVIEGEGSPKRIELYRAEVEAIHRRITETEAGITVLHEQIAKLQASLSPDDLAFL